MRKIDEELKKSAKAGDLEKVKLLISLGASAKNVYFSGLHCAAEVRDYDIFRCLMKEFKNVRFKE